MNIKTGGSCLTRAACFRLNGGDKTPPPSIKGGIFIAREKTSGIYFKVSEKDRDMIEQRMAQTQIRNMSAFIRKMCIDGMVINLNIKQLDEIGKLLRVTANNVNQIARRVNSGGGAYRDDVAQVNTQLENIRTDFGAALNDLSKMQKDISRMK